MVAAPSWAIDHMSLATPIEKAVIAGTPIWSPPISLAGADTVLLTKTGREYVLERALRDVANSYD